MIEETTPRRERRRRAKSEAPAPLIEATEGEVSPFDHPGTVLRRNRRAARRGFYAPAVTGAPSTTRQAEILNTAIIGTPTGTDGVVIGEEVLSQTPFAHDGVTAYNATPRRITSPNVLRVGDVGGGKSSGAKCNDILRPLVLRGRSAVVFDKKNRSGEGEYAELVRFYGGEPIRFTTDGDGTCLNLMDPLITKAGLDDDGDYAGEDGRYALLHNVLRQTRDGRDLDEWEEESLRSALRSTDHDLRRTPVIADVLPHFGDVDTAEYRTLQPAARDRLHEAGLTLRFALNGLLESYSGLLDGETSKSVDLTGKLTSWDISQLPDDGPAIPVVMSMGYMWLLGRLKAQQHLPSSQRQKTTLLWEEGWHAVDGPIATLLRSSMKLSRARGVSNVFNMHKGTDIPETSPGMTVVQEAQTIYVYRQSRRLDAEWCVRTFDLAPDSVERIMHLPNGHFIAKVGDQPEVELAHIRSDVEIALTDTDEGLGDK